MDARAESGAFLRACRERITPQQAGVLGGDRRRVPGLRREEVALLAGISVEYYARLERGALRGASPEVLDALARALHLDVAETEHLHALAAGPRRDPRSEDPDPARTRASLQRIVDAVSTPMWVRDRRMDLVTANAAGRALYAPLLEAPESEGNTARFTFLSPASRDFFRDWEDGAAGIVATLRASHGQAPEDDRLLDLVEELRARSEDFRRRWELQEVRHHRAGSKRLRHPEVGDLEVSYTAMAFPARPEWILFGYTAAPGTPSAERLARLGRDEASSSHAVAVGGMHRP